MVEPAAEAKVDTPSASRLVIRVKLIPQEPAQQPPARRGMSRSALLLILGAGAVLLSWLGLSIFRPDASPAGRTEDSPVVADEPLPKPVIETRVTTSVQAEAKPVEPEVPQRPDAPPSPINEVIPDVPQSALDTIRGTVRVSVRVTIDKQGTVVDAAAADRGPSRYFERLSVEASRNWTFTPATSEQQRLMLLRFHFTRAGATAYASPL